MASWPLVRNRRSSGSPDVRERTGPAMCSAGIHCRNPISACPVFSRTYDRCTVLIPFANPSAQPMCWRLTPAVHRLSSPGPFHPAPRSPAGRAAGRPSARPSPALSRRTSGPRPSPPARPRPPGSAAAASCPASGPAHARRPSTRSASAARSSPPGCTSWPARTVQSGQSAAAGGPAAPRVPARQRGHLSWRQQPPLKLL